MKAGTFVSAVAICALVAGAAPAAAQVNILSAATVTLDEGAPSARALALGGAFIGLADDASTMLTNPAGMRLLGRREVVAEFRQRQLDTVFPLRGRRFGSATGQGVDTINGIVTDTHRATAPMLPALGAVAFPSSRWAIGFFWHEQGHVNFEIRSRSEGLFATESDGTVIRLASQVQISRLTRDSFGGALSISATPTLSIGVGLFLTKIDFTGSTAEIEPPSTFAPAEFPEGIVTGAQSSANYRMDGFLPGATVGVSWSPTAYLHVGFAHRRGVRGEMTTDTFVSGTGLSLLDRRQTFSFAMPDRTGGGVAVRLGHGRVALDVVHVRYANLSDNFVDVLAPITGTSQASFYRHPNGLELRAGGEYVVVVGRASLAARAGWWRDPRHAPVYEGPDLREASRFPLQDDPVRHVSAGAGVLVGHWEFDVGFEVSRINRLLSLGFVARF
jgi:hypothetical protein